MIHVFLVDAGFMYEVDVSLQHPVSRLNEQIAGVSRIPVEKQVLLMSGGVPLFPDKPLCYYESILDNPVYLICKSSVTDVIRPPSSIYSYSDHDLTSQVEASSLLPATMDTVKTRTQLAQRVCHVDEGQLKVIEHLVYDQHLQQQGWAAVVANLEDLVSGFDKRANTFKKQFKEFLASRENIMSLARRMPDVLILLEKIPVLPCLENLASNSSVSLKGPLDMLPSGKLTLYAWMDAQDSKHKLEDVSMDLINGIDQMGEELEEKVAKEVEDVIKYASGTCPDNLKSIKGLEERLYGLDKLSKSAQTTVEGQRNMKKGFEQNKSRLELVKDNSILPDLCASHRKQMKDMHVNHRKLMELKKKCIDAKKELSENLQHRLRWVMNTHHLINDMDNRLLMHYDLLNRIQVRAEFLRQVEQAPHVYASMVVEVARRRLFSQHYMKWAKGVADESRKEYKKEMHRRRSFTKQFGSHFLQKLFVGFKDNVPKFAVEAPKDIDGQLPDISASDIDSLARCVPELKQQLRIPTGTGSPALQMSFQQPLAADGGSDPLMIEVTQSMVSSTASFITQSVTSTAQSVSEGAEAGQIPLLGPAEQERRSLSYQEGMELRGEADDQLFLSLQEKFPVPQCLSETLTAEVNSAAMSTISASVMSASPKAHELSSALEQLGQQQQQPQQEAGGGGDGVLYSSGDLEPAKSSDSDAISHESLSEHKPRSKRRRTKGLSDTSPDGETSQEFTTADFYIEDSMPSSITDSPPKPVGAGKDQGEMDAVLAEQTKRVGELEGEVSALQSKLAGSEEKLASLQSVLDSDISSLRESLAGIRECVQQGDSQRNQAVSEAGEAFLGMCALLAENAEREREQSLSSEREGSRQTVEALESQLQAKSKLVDELQQSMLKVSNGIADLNKELQKMRDSRQNEVETLVEQHRTELEEVRKKNLIEVELERENIKAEMQQQLDVQETEVQRLQQELEQLQSRFARTEQENTTASQTLLQDFTREKEELRQTLESEKHQAIKEVKAAMMEEQQRRFETVVKEEVERNNLSVQRQLEQTFARRSEEQKDELFEKHMVELKSLENEWSLKLTSRESKLRKEFEVELDRQRQELLAASERHHTSEQGVQSSEEEVMSMNCHLEKLKKMENDTREETALHYDKLLEEEREERARIMAELEQQHERDKEEALHNLKITVAAERQVQFNEAITKAVREKDRLIEELKTQLDSMASAIGTDDENQEETQNIKKELANIKEKESRLKGEKRQLEDEVSLLQRQLRQYSEQLHSMTASASPLMLPASVAVDSSVLAPSEQEEGAFRLTNWEQIAGLREQKIHELEEKLMSTSMTSSFRGVVRDKVSILSCTVGDLVLLCLDERHDQYVVFTVGSTLHFLHSECLDALGIRAAEGQPRKNWVLAEVTEREYCQARKPQNRFKVPVNTKFYRVKAKPWSPASSSS